MSRKQLGVLFVCNLAPFFVGNALLPLLPIYTMTLGADEGSTGVYLGLAFASLAAGALLSGWLSDHFQRRKLTLIVAGGISLPILLLMTLATDMITLTVLTMIIWFMGGLLTATASILVGLYADPLERGRIFGIIGISGGLAQILGGLIAGPVVDRWGFAVLFVVVAVPYVFQIILSATLEDKTVPASAGQTRPGEPRQAIMNLNVWLLLIANMLVITASFSAGLSRPLFMNTLSFDATAISSTQVVAGIVILPLPLVTGWLSDRLGRKPLLLACYALVGFGSLVLFGASILWIFWLSTVFTSMAGVSGAVGSALVTDLVPQERLGTALSWFGATQWIGGVFGYGATGFIMQAMGTQTTFLVIAAVPLLALLMILSIRPAARVVPAES